MEDIIKFLRSHVSLFEGFSEENLYNLVIGSRLVSFESQEAIIEFGQTGCFLGVLIDGEAQVSVTDDNGDIHSIAVLKPGDMFGEMSLMTGDKTMADVIGVTPCKAILIPQALFTAMIITQPSAIKMISKTISERLKQLGSLEKRDDLAASALKKSGDPYGLQLKSSEPLKLLVLNCEISSLHYNLFNTENEALDVQGIIENIGQEGAYHIYKTKGVEQKTTEPLKDLGAALGAMLKMLTAPKIGVINSIDEIAAVGHRVVHGGDRFSSAVVIDQKVLKDIEALEPLAPLNNPMNLLGIKEAMKLFSGKDKSSAKKHVAVFDTTFHSTLPPYAYLYGLPYDYFKNKKIKRYGFHGLSHAYASLKAAEYLKLPYNALEIATCHLGKGSSICAVDHGRSVDNSMGLTPVDGLIMGTRSGSLDPALLIHLMRTENLTADDLDELINKKSGLLGLSGISDDIREIEAAADKGNQRAILAVKSYCYQIRKCIGAYMAAMGGLDVLVFSGSIGQESPGVRSLSCQDLSCMGICIDEEKNNKATGLSSVCDISADNSAVRVLVVPANEELMIAREMIRTLDMSYVADIIEKKQPLSIPLEISAHHVHLSQEHLEALFGKGHKLTNEYELSQPDQYACKEKVTLVGPKGKIERVRVLGPTRSQTQIEIAMTEQFKLGIQPPIRQSGDIENSPGITIQGTKGSITTDKGVICAMRHIHMSPEDALSFGLHDKDVVRIRVEGDRELIFGDVLIRVNPNYRLAMHIDTDEANAAHIAKDTVGYLDGIQSRG
ncbi:MAG: acetate/propionate family kinase [Spirochaetales bacterium]|nr:acetate/propionate family kinase [Spirochaetales bacterium]